MSGSACHCLCGVSHAATPGICDGEHATTTRRLVAPVVGVVDVPMCQPCADALDIRETVNRWFPLADWQLERLSLLLNPGQRRHDAD